MIIAPASAAPTDVTFVDPAVGVPAHSARSQTVSKREFRKIKKGQSVAKVNRIIGGKLDRVGKQDGRTVYVKRTTTFLGLAEFQFRGKKLKTKAFNVFYHD